MHSEQNNHEKISYYTLKQWKYLISVKKKEIYFCNSSYFKNFDENAWEKEK